jgi:Chromo (CHRromatin Organisation MOdifier) domain
MEDVEATEFEVERIVDKRIKQGKEQFRVRWSGYGEKDDTWEPVKNLNCPDKIQEFEESLESSKEPSSEVRC